MTEKESKEFFEAVKGKKIRFTSWINKEDFLIPKALKFTFGEYVLEGEITSNQQSMYTAIPCYAGFKLSLVGRWILIDQDTNIIDSKEICTCDRYDLFNNGCKCGAFKKELDKKNKIK